MRNASLVLISNPFRPLDGRIVKAIPRRRRIATLAPSTDQPFICLYNGQPLLRRYWQRRVKRGDVVAFVTLPQGGGGGGSNPLKMVLQIAVMVMAPQLSMAMLGEVGAINLVGGLTLQTVTSAALGFVGNALINAVLPPPRQPTTQAAAMLAAPSPTYSLGAQGNMARMGAAIPVMYGRHVIYPDFAAQPFSEFIANEQYLHLLFCLGQGEFQIEQIRFDKSDADAYGGDVVQEVIPPYGVVTLFPTNVVTSAEVNGQEVMGRKDLSYTQTGTLITVTETAHTRTLNSTVSLNFTSGTAVDGEYVITGLTANDWTVAATTATTSGAVLVFSILGGFVANAAGTPTNTIDIDIALPKGLGYIDGNGVLQAMSLTFRVEVRAINDNGAPVGGWAVLPPLAPVVPVQFSDSTTQLGYLVAEFPWFQKMTLSHANVLEISIVLKRAGVVITGWTLSVGTGAGGVDEVFIPLAYQINNSFYSRILWQCSYRIISTQEDEYLHLATQTPQRKSYSYPIALGRYEVRLLRLDVKNTASNYMHDLNWIALDAYIPSATTYGNVTMLALKIRASATSPTAAQKVNVIASRCIPTWDAVAGWSAPVPTQSIAWALADCAKAQYGGKLTDAQLNLPALAALDAVWSARGDAFNGVFDNSVSLWEALTSIARAGRAKPYLLGGVLQVQRDAPQAAPMALFSMRNIEQGSFAVDYAFPSETTTDSVEVSYFDEAVWGQRTVMCTLPGDTANNPAKINAFGITNRAQAHREGLYMAAANRYRRKAIKLRTEMEGFIPVYGDMVAIQADMPNWGQHGEVVAYDAGAGELVVSEQLAWTAGATHYIGLRNRDGSLTDAVAVVQGSSPDRCILQGALPMAYVDVGGDRERTHISFGAGDTWRQLAIVTNTTPRSLTSVELSLINDNPLVHTAEDSVPTPPWVGW